MPMLLTDDTAATAPLIVNGLTVHPRKKVNAWQFGLLLLPDFATALLVLVGLGVHRLLRYLDAQRKTES
jgi:hypothetical protein